MGKYLEAFATDNLMPGTHYFEQNSAYGRAMRKLTNAEDSLISQLGDAEKNLLKEYSAVQGELNCLTGEHGFINGYCLGVLLTMEAFAHGDHLIADGEGE